VNQNWSPPIRRSRSILKSRSSRLTEVDYFWEPVPGCWTVRRDESGAWVNDYQEPDPDPAPFTTIAWRLAHIADCKVMYHEYAFGASRLTFPDLEAPSTVAAVRDVAHVETAFTSVSSRSFTRRTVTSLMFVSPVAGSMEMVFPRMARSAAIVMPAPSKT